MPGVTGRQLFTGMKLFFGGRWVRFVSSFLFALALGSTAFAAREQFPGLDAKWRAYQSPNFELFSRGSERSSRALLTDLEAMRAFFMEHFDLPVRDTPPVTIYVFGSPRDFRHYTAAEARGDYTLIGEYRPYFDRDVISLSADWGDNSASWIVFSNYTKHLLNGVARNRASAVYQGLGMLLGNLVVREKSVDFGEPDRLRRELAQANPVRDLEHLLTLEEGRAMRPDQEQANVFHAQAWAFFHYLYLGQTDVSRADVNRFLRFLLIDPAANDPVRLGEVFREIFQVDYTEMTKRLVRYTRASRFFSERVPIPAVARSVNVAVRPVDRSEMQERLAELALRSTRDPAGKFALLDALRGPRAARAAEALGNDVAQDRDDRAAQDYWQRALDAGSTNPVVLRLVTQLEYARWFGTFDFYFRLAPDKTEELRALLRRNLEATPHRMDTYEMLAWVESAAPSPDLASVNLVQRKFPELHHPARTLLALALVRARLKDDAGALSLLDGLEKLEPEPRERAFAVQVRRILQSRLPAAE